MFFRLFCAFTFSTLSLTLHFLPSPSVLSTSCDFIKKKRKRFCTLLNCCCNTNTCMICIFSCHSQPNSVTLPVGPMLLLRYLSFALTSLGLLVQYSKLVLLGDIRIDSVAILRLRDSVMSENKYTAEYYVLMSRWTSF